jgi:hypothetical protein
MMSAKDELFDRIKYLDYAIKQSNLIDNGIAQSEHNGAANILRKGLGIVAFNILEDFIKNKTIEALTQVANSGIEFSNLTSKLQNASILEALQALVFRAKLTKKEGGDWKALIQEETLKIHSTKNQHFEFSQFSLLSSNSNVLTDEVPELLTAFGITGGWTKLKSVSDSIGGGIPDLNMSYRNASERRHNSAHLASFRYEYTWLSQIKRDIISISASIDILLTARCRQIRRNLLSEISIHNIDNDLNYHFLEEDNGKYRETKQISGRARKVWNTLNEAEHTLKPRLEIQKEFLIILDSGKNIVNWIN